MRIRFLFLIASIIYYSYSFSQDTIRKNSSPKKALILSTLIPGGGQIYNDIHKKSFQSVWKVPIIYSSLFFSTKTLIEKINLEKELKTEYFNRENNIYSDKWKNYDNFNLVTLHNQVSKSRNTMFFIVGGIYIIQLLEASIDAHFTHFDISPDLSLNVNPYYSLNNESGIRFSFNLK
jgi:hypothetical protein